MKVIVAGFSKTGTKTMNAALRALGYNVYDFLEHFWYAGNQWTACMERGEIEGLKEIYESVDAVCDTPAFYFWDELLELFPEAKVILLMRDEDSWLKSVENHLVVNNSNFVFRILPICPTGLALHRFMNSLGITVFGVLPQWPWEARKFFYRPTRRAYRMHNAHVLSRVPKDKLLVYDVKEGWGPLCEFLDIEAPKKPFPHKNKGGEIIEEVVKEHPVMQRIQKEMTVIIVGLSTLLLAGCYQAYPYVSALVTKFL